jgi:hypothetical protein
MTKSLTTAFMAALIGTFVLTGGLATEAHAKKNVVKYDVDGWGNDVRVAQKGKRSKAHGMVFGNGHQVDVEQNGDDNTSGVLVVGNGAKVKRKQNGNGRLDIDIAVGD